MKIKPVPFENSIQRELAHWEPERASREKELGYIPCNTIFVETVN
jgi:hypothetical protein